MAKTRAEIQAAYRERRRQKLGEKAYLEAESRRVKKYYVPVERLSKKQVRERRQNVNKRVRKHRSNVREALAKLRRNEQDDLENMAEQEESADDSAISDISYAGPSTRSTRRTPLVVKMPFARPTRRRKRISKCLDRAHKTIETLRRQVQAANRQNKKIRKRNERLLKAKRASSTPITNASNTPRSKTLSMLKNAGIHGNRSKHVKKHLLFSNAILDELASVSKCSSSKYERRVLHNIVSGSKVLKKYRLLSMVQKSSGLGRRNLARATGKLSWSKMQTKPLWKSLHDEVTDFLERDDNSRIMPGKKDACKTGDSGDKKQKRYLTDYMANLHMKYVAENPEKRHVSLSAFNRVRRNLCPHIKLVEFASRNTCLCQRHQNLSLKLKALKALRQVTTTNPDQFIKDNSEQGVQSLLRSVQAEHLEFEQWSRVTADGRKKTKLVRLSLSREEFCSRFSKDVQEFRLHVLRVQNQYRAMSKCKQDLPPDHCIVHMDFAENYTCVPLEEVQSGYWAQDSVTIHPIVVYHRDEEGNLVHKSLVAVSDERAHNTSTILAIITALMPKLKEAVPDLSQVHYWTDSPTAQYRNKTMFSVVCDHSELFGGVQAQWDYFEAGHGKGPCDGIGGTVKRLADEAVKRRAAVIQDAHDFFAWACQERHTKPENKIEYFFITKEDCVASAQTIADKWCNVKTFPGTLCVHSVIGVQGHLLMRNDSCYCEKCYIASNEYEKNTMCSGWKPQYLSRQLPQNMERKQSSVQPDKVMIPYNTDDWVAAVYEDKWYIGTVLEADDDDISIHFMRSSDSFPNTLNGLQDRTTCGYLGIRFCVTLAPQNALRCRSAYFGYQIRTGKGLWTCLTSAKPQKLNESIVGVV